MRLVLCVAVGLLWSAATAATRQSEPPVSVERLRLALQEAPQPSIVLPNEPALTGPRRTRLGVLTIIPPDTRGEMVKIAIPVGTLVTRAAQSVSHAHRRRAERKAQERVLRELEDFHAQRK